MKKLFCGDSLFYFGKVRTFKYNYVPLWDKSALIISTIVIALAYLLPLPIRKIRVNPTVQMIRTIKRMKWASLAFSGMGTD